MIRSGPLARWLLLLGQSRSYTPLAWSVLIQVNGPSFNCRPDAFVRPAEVLDFGAIDLNRCPLGPDLTHTFGSEAVY
jgi:hypothetical protein